MEKKIQLRPPKNAEEWERLHQLRREELFARHFPEVTYDADHPDDRHSCNHPLVLVAQNAVVGTVRLDELDDSRIAVRLVVIDSAMQGKGFGRTLMERVELYAKKIGGSELLINSLESAVGFYEKIGFEAAEPFDGPTVRALSIQQTPMKKKIDD